MERFSREQKPANSTAGHTQASSSANHSGASKSAGVLDKPTMAAKVLVFTLIVAALAVTGALAANVFGNTSADRFVKEGQYQAVFLDNGQVYFGKLSDTGSSYVHLTDIFYLQVNQQVQPDQVEQGQEATPAADQISLAKLGNELHGPEDEMFISRAKIVFWENLKTDGQVTTAVNEFKNGQAEQ